MGDEETLWQRCFFIVFESARRNNDKSIKFSDVDAFVVEVSKGLRKIDEWPRVEE